MQPQAHPDVTDRRQAEDRGHDLDETAALEAKKRAEEALADAASEMDYAQAQAELASTIAQIRSIEKLRKLKK